MDFFTEKQQEEINGNDKHFADRHFEIDRQRILDGLGT